MFRSRIFDDPPPEAVAGYDAGAAPRSALPEPVKPTLPTTDNAPANVANVFREPSELELRAPRPAEQDVVVPEDLEIPDPPDGMHPSKREAWHVAKFWDRLAAWDRSTDSERHTLRIVVAWRFARHMIRLCRLDPDHRPLSEVFDQEGGWDFLRVPSWRGTENAYTLAQVSGVDKPQTGYVGGVATRVLLAVAGRPLVEVESSADPIALGIRPPKIPAAWVEKETGAISTKYDPENPEHDEKLARWMRVFRRVVDYLGIRHGTPRDRHFGQLALKDLESPWTIRAMWPTQAEVACFDELVLQAVNDIIVERGQDEAAAYLKSRYGLGQGEIREILACSRTALLGCHDLSAETARAILSARLEKILAKAVKNDDTRIQLNVAKLLISIHGISRTKPQDGDMEFVRSVLLGGRGDSRQRDAGPAPLEVKDFDVV